MIVLKEKYFLEKEKSVDGWEKLETGKTYYVRKG